MAALGRREVVRRNGKMEAHIGEYGGERHQVYFSGLAAAIEHIRAGRLRALAVTTATRLDVLPEVPTLSEFLPGYPAARSSGRRDRPRGSCASCRCQNRSRRQTARAGTAARRHDKISISWPFVTHINGGWVLQWGAFRCCHRELLLLPQAFL